MFVFLFYLLNRKMGLGILDFKGLVSPVAAAAVTGAGITGNALLLLPPVAVSLGFFLSPHSDSHFCFSEENSSTFVSVLLLLSGCCCCCATRLFDFLATGQNVATECAGKEVWDSSYWDCFECKTWVAGSLIASEISKWFKLYASQ
jgi:hypothetical protein